MCTCSRFRKNGRSYTLAPVLIFPQERGSLGSKFSDRTNPMDKHMAVMIEKAGFERSPPTAQLFGNAGREHMKLFHSFVFQRFYHCKLR